MTKRIAFLAWLLAPTAATGQADIDLALYATTGQNQQVVLRPATFEPIVLGKGLCAGNQCLYSSTSPGFRSPTTGVPSENLAALASGSRGTIEIVSIDPSVSIKVGSTVLDRAGETATLGTAPIHIHPSWQAVLAGDATGEFEIQFRVSATGIESKSDPYKVTLVIEGDAAATATPTASPTASASVTPTSSPTVTASGTRTPTTTAVASASATPTATSTAAPTASCVGDCDGSREVTVDEIVLGIALALGSADPGECAAIDASGDGIVTVDEIVRAIQSALNGCGASERRKGGGGICRGTEFRRADRFTSRVAHRYRRRWAAQGRARSYDAGPPAATMIRTAVVASYDSRLLVTR